MTVAASVLAVSLCAHAQNPVPPGAHVEKVAGGFQFVEGPLWKDGVGLLFSDINGNTIYRWSANSGTKVYLTPTGNSNGLTFDRQGRLLFAQQGGRKVVRQEFDSSWTVLAATFRGKKLNSPNDLVVKSDGSIFFTDPPYGIQPSQQEVPFNGIYRINPAGDLQVLDSTLSRPNGIAFSPDESKLYVNDTEVRTIYVWDVVADSLIVNKRQFALMKSSSGGADGMKVDSAGNVFSAGPGGIWVFSPAGTVLDTILVPGQTTNCGWGEKDRKTLYITAGTSVYRIRTGLTSVPGTGALPEKGFWLGANYPNPFNPSTTIVYSVRVPGQATLEVFDVLGRRAASLFDGAASPGVHSTTWDAAGFASGVYIARISSGGLLATRKMLLAR